MKSRILKSGSSGRIRTYNPSVNSRNGFSRLTLQTQVLARAKCRFSQKLGGLWGDLNAFIAEPATSWGLRFLAHVNCFLLKATIRA